MKCVWPWTWFKVVVLRRGANLGGTEIGDSLWCKSFFRFCVCFSFLLCNLTMTVWMGSIGQKVKTELLRLTWWEAARDSRKRWCWMTRKKRKGFINLVIWISGILILFSLFCVLCFHLGCRSSQRCESQWRTEKNPICSYGLQFKYLYFIFSYVWFIFMVLNLCSSRSKLILVLAL